MVDRRGLFPLRKTILSKNSSSFVFYYLEENTEFLRFIDYDIFFSLNPICAESFATGLFLRRDFDPYRLESLQLTTNAHRMLRPTKTFNE